MIGSTLSILAGGGGGSSGGHTASTEGFGGNGGLPGTSGGFASGTNGTDGRDTSLATVVGGGAGGTDTAPGAGGVHSTTPARNGTAGVNRTGGNGGADDNADTGGGGGGGFFGGGGGASTTDEGAAGNITGGGGGGGSSFVASTATNISSSSGPKLTGSAQGAGAAGSVTLTWIGCDYDLAVTKSASASTTTIGDPVTWTVAISNLGPAAMTQGDTVTLADTLPGSGTKTISSISASGGTNTDLSRGPVTCNAAVGDPMPASLSCSRPFQPLNGAVDGVRGLDVGETLTITYTQIAAGSVAGVLTNTATVSDRTTGDTNDSATATTTLTAEPPVASDDADLNNVIGSTVNVSVLGNDSGTIVVGSVALIDPTSNTASSGPVTVPGEGTWSVSASGVVTFQPEAGFTGNPTPITYQVTDSNGLTDTAVVTVTYAPQAVNDKSTGNEQGKPVTIDVIGNDEGTFDPQSVRLIDPGSGARATRVVVPGEGTWTVDPTTGAITFTPSASFTGDPTPLRYEVTDRSGSVTSATVTITFVHPLVAALASTGAAVSTALAIAILMVVVGIIVIQFRRRAARMRRAS